MVSPLVDIIIASFESGGEGSNYLELCLKTIHDFTEVPHRVLLERSRESASVNRNRGIARSTAPYICFLDDDAWVTPNWLAQLLELMESNEQLGMIGPKLIMENGQIFCFGLGYIPPTHISPIAYGIFDDGNYEGLIEPFAIPTTCLLVRREAVEAAGLFNTDYVSCQWEDIDYYLRLRLSGYRGLVTGGVTIYHRHLFRSSHFEVNNDLFLRQWAPHLPKFV